MNVFSTEINQYNTVPPKWKMFIVVLSSVAISLLYLAIGIFTVFVLGDYCIVDTNGRFVISILEMALTLVSLLLAIMATHISDCIQDSFVNRLKRIYELNPFLQNELKINEAIERAENNKRNSRNAKRVIFAVFFLYFTTSCLRSIITEAMILQQFLAWGFGSLSTFFSVILAITSFFLVTCLEIM